MRKVPGKVQTYKVYGADGRLDGEGTAKELSGKYYVVPSLISLCSRDGHKMGHQYTIVKDKIITRPEVAERWELVKRLYQDGIPVPQISEQTNISKSAIYTHLREMRGRGEIA